MIPTMKLLIKITIRVSNYRVWMSNDETTDIEGRFIANVIIGTLDIQRVLDQYFYSIRNN